MKKIVKGLICTGLCSAMALGIGAAGCAKKGGGGFSGDSLDTETRALQLAIGALDQKFNPLYYTSQNDGEIANMTQVSLLTADMDKNGSIVLEYGNDVPTVALAYQETFYSCAEGDWQAIGCGDGINTSGKTDSDFYTGATEYSIVIKNGIKFSDGMPLTVMDVLFNLYVYLDPAYSGSSTIYSTKIDGLQKYRQQDKDADDSVSGSSDALYASKAKKRIENIVDWAEDMGDTPAADSQLGKDIAKIRELFEEEVKADWNSIYNTWVEDFKEYRVTEAWQAFYLNEGVISTQEKDNGDGTSEELKDADGKYYTTLDPDYTVDPPGTPKAQGIIDEMAAATTDEQRKDIAIARVLRQADGWGVGSKLFLRVDNDIIYLRGACAEAYEYFLAEERDNANSGKDEKDKVHNISGITVERSNKLVNEYDSTKTVTFEDGEHDIVKIRILGVDPKAKWNFSLNIAPMHIYSDATRQSDGTYKGTYYSAAMDAYTPNDTTTAGSIYSSTCKSFGIKFGDPKWLSSNVASKASLPKGAGAYKVRGSTASQFFDGSMCYFERNPYFKTMFGKAADDASADSYNAKIKYVNYKVLPDDKIVSALLTGEIDYGEPIAKGETMTTLRENSSLDTSIMYDTAGYGYIGINPAHVPDMEVRQALMHVFDTDRAIKFYGNAYASQINRPMSITSWAYPENVTPYYNFWGVTGMVDTDGDGVKDKDSVKAVQDLITSSKNWDLKNGKIVNKNGKQLSLTFTIAGSSTDHPAYRMFQDAQTFLGKCGVSVKISPDPQALKKLVSGSLEVWAAAWSSSIDPDPYQIYSKHSNASSTNNWGKSAIYDSKNAAKYAKEIEIIDTLSEKIDLGRTLLTEQARKPVYAECLDLIMSLAVEFPTYQRKDLCVFNKKILQKASLNGGTGNFLKGPIDDIWLVDYVK